jgi:hypothetical protein
MRSTTTAKLVITTSGRVYCCVSRLVAIGHTSVTKRCSCLRGRFGSGIPRPGSQNGLGNGVRLRKPREAGVWVLKREDTLQR